MRTVQDYLRDLDRAKLMEAFFPYVSGVCEKCAMVDEFVDYLIQEDSLENVGGKHYILLAFPCYETNKPGSDMEHTLICMEELLKKGEKAKEYDYDVSPHSEVLGYYVADTSYTQEYIYELIAEVLHTLLLKKEEQDFLSRPLRLWPTDEEQNKLWEKVYRAIKKYRTYCYKRELLTLKKILENPSEITGIPTGFANLDHMIQGLRGGELIAVAARPAMGKTAFALQIAQHVALKEDKKVAIFSLEMSKESLVKRLSIGEHSNMIIDDTPGISILEFCNKCRKYKLENDLSMIVIDYVQLMSGVASETRQQEISEISRSLKAVARELKVPVLALLQISRTDRKPMLSDLRESEGIMQNADIIMFIYREVYYHAETDRPEAAEIIIAKNCGGETGSVELRWNGKWFE